MAINATRFIVWGIGAIALVAVVLALRPQPIQVDFAVVEHGQLRVTIDEEGETRVRDRFVVSAPLAGLVLRIELEPGDPVVADETVLATFQPGDPTLLDARTRAEAEARVRAAEAGLGRARVDRERAAAESAFARAEFDRRRELAELDLVSREQLESAELRARTRGEALRSAEFAIRSAEYELEVAQASLLQVRDNQLNGTSTRSEAIVLRSPIDGVVLRRLRESEAIVPAGEPLLEVADPAELEIVSDLLSTDAVKIRTGQKVLIEQWGDARALRGRVRRVEPSGFTKISALGVEEQRVNVVIDFEDVHEAWEALGDAYRVEVRVVIWEGDVLKTPTSSLFRRGQDWAVYTVRDGTATLRLVEVGQRNSLEAEVLTGLERGEQVIVHPSDAIDDGIAVVARS